MRRSTAGLFALAAALYLPAQAGQSVQTGAKPIFALPQAGLSAMGAALHGLPRLESGLSPAAGLAAPMPLPAAAAPVVAAPQSPVDAPLQSLSGMADAVQPDLEALQSQEVQGEQAWGLAEKVMAPAIGRSVAAPDAVSVPTERAKPKAKPLLSQVSFSESVSQEHQALLWETLSRRKAGWKYGLANMGLKLDGSVAPALSVLAAKPVAKGKKVLFSLEWNQGETHVGAFKAYVVLKNLNPEFYRLAAPEPPKERQLKMRFKKTVVATAGGISFEQEVGEADIAAFLEAKGLRLLRKNWEGYYDVAVTGNAQADTVARAISGKDIVLYATPATFAVPEANQIRIAFKKITARNAAETDVTETEIGELLSRFGLRVLSVDRRGVYTAGSKNLRAQAAARALQLRAQVLYASPVLFAPAWTSQLIVKFHKTYIFGGFEADVREDNVASLFKRHGLLVVGVLGEGLYKVARVTDGAPAGKVAEAIAAEPFVESARPLGGLSEERIRSVAQGVISHKGRPFSHTEYSAALAQAAWQLEVAGATPEQLQLFQDLCAAAPVRGGGFNQWSGD